MADIPNTGIEDLRSMIIESRFGQKVQTPEQLLEFAGNPIPFDDGVFLTPLSQDQTTMTKNSKYPLQKESNTGHAQKRRKVKTGQEGAYRYDAHLFKQLPKFEWSSLYCLPNNTSKKDYDVDQASTAASTSFQPPGAEECGPVMLDDLEEMVM